MPAAGRSEYRLATGPVTGSIHPDSDNYPDGHGELEQRAHRQPGVRPADTGRRCPPGQVRDVTDHGEKAGADYAGAAAGERAPAAQGQNPCTTAKCRWQRT
jgi:hypothetical protein